MVTPPKNQGSCGSCWAFATVGVFESLLLLKNRPFYDLSEQDVLSCSGAGSCASGGFPYYGLKWALTNGIATEAVLPYNHLIDYSPLCPALSAITTPTPISASLVKHYKMLTDTQIRDLLY